MKTQNFCKSEQKKEENKMSQYLDRGIDVAIVHLLIQDQKDRLHGVVGQHRLDAFNVWPSGALEVLLAEHVPAELVVVRDLEDLGVLDGAKEVVDEALDGVVHLVALLLTLKLQVDDDSRLAFTLLAVIVIAIHWILNRKR